MTKIHLLQFIVNLNHPYSDICYEKNILLKLKYCNIQKKNQVSWYHEGQLIQDKTSHRINLDSDGTLQVAEARASDAGKYTCEVSSSGQDTYFFIPWLY